MNTFIQNADVWKVNNNYYSYTFTGEQCWNCNKNCLKILEKKLKLVAYSELEMQIPPDGCCMEYKYRLLTPR